MSTDESCAVAHGAATVPDVETRALVVVFDTPVARQLIAFATAVGYRTTLVDPRGRSGALTELPELDGTVDVVVTDHHREELATVLRDVLAHPTRWIGVMGNPRHPAPYLEPLAALGVSAVDIERIHRPIGLNIGSRTPPEIALATLAGLLADRNGRKGGFDFS